MASSTRWAARTWPTPSQHQTWWSGSTRLRNRGRRLRRWRVRGKVWLGVAVLDGKIYAVGGYNRDDGTLSSVERYDPETNAWEAVAPMATAREYHVMAVLDGKLYAVGGTFSSVERYDPRTNAWEEVAPMATARVNPAAAALDGKLYAVGGYSGDGSDLSSVERYDPTTNAWEAVVPMATARFALGVAVLDGKLYAAGGQKEDDEDGDVPVNTVERFDPVTNGWEAVAPMVTARRSLADDGDGCLMMRASSGFGLWKKNRDRRHMHMHMCTCCCCCCCVRTFSLLGEKREGVVFSRPLGALRAACCVTFVRNLGRRQSIRESPSTFPILRS